MLEQNQVHFGRRTETAASSQILPSHFERSSNFNGSGQSEPSNRICSPFYPNAILSTAGRREEHYQLVVQTLLGALNTSIECGRNAWDFAVEITELTKLGVSKHLLRVMVCDGVIEHRREITSASRQERSFEPETDVVLTERSCFVLSDFGRRVFASNAHPTIHHQEEKRMQNGFNGHAAHGHNGLAVSVENVPVWDPQRRELRLGDVVVKRFKWPAMNQEQVLRAFQEEGWPAQIDDPLPPDPKICPKRRLHDTIKCPNRRQVNSVIKFRGDGTGQGVILEIVKESEKSDKEAVSDTNETDGKPVLNGNPIETV